MPLFTFSAKSNTGEIKTGTIDVASETELAHSLREQGFILTSVQLLKEPLKIRNRMNEFLPSFSFVPLSEKMIFARNMAVMIGAGLSLNRALDALASQTKNKNFSKIISSVSEDVKKGQPLAESLNKHPKIFSELFVNMVKVGETGGNLEGTLNLLAHQLEKDHELRAKVKSAMIYPAVIVTVMLVIGIVMMTTVVPKLTEIFKEMNTDLPWSTQFIISFSNFLSQHWLLSILIVVALVFCVRFLLKTKNGKMTFDLLLLKSPIFGDISKKINSARLARTLGSLIESTVPIVQGLQIVAGTMSNYQFRESLTVAAQEVQKGNPLSTTIKAFPNLYPPTVNQMIQVGEETGTLGSILIKLADFYEEEVSNVTKGMSAIVEPILMVIIGAVVGFFAISMIQPMYSIMGGM
jgi:type IV pilus assembly protein PilC